ncbi:head maturation protease, ClpP-related [Xanthomonas translucens]|uniref:head maturation protease, ClpP-related n=1 Tax=Xanthomonas campestris pv. translucens TaxID=343 RepID=UPI00071E967E|nr:head maturation protease, ClpP-related [Xanthomonas translucens]
MSLRRIPAAPGERLQARVGKLPRASIERWGGSPQAAYVDGRTIYVHGVIGEDWSWDEAEGGLAMTGTTSAQIATYLAKLGNGPITVSLNSPGGDMFEGLAIYNLFREHGGQVNIDIVGVAASAASVIAMAGDTVRIGKSAFLMIHNTWLTYSGNRRSFVEMAAQLLPFDKAMAGIYADRTGIDEEELLSLMDSETWISGADAISKGFADAVLADGSAKEKPQASARTPQTPRASAEAAQVSTAALLALQAASASLSLSI